MNIKDLAKEQIRGKILMLFLASIVAGAVIGASSVIGIGPLLVSPIITVGLVFIRMDIRDGRDVDIVRIFEPFRYFTRVWCAMFLTGLYQFLWSLLFVIPGIVKSFSYAMVPYIVAENPEIGANEAITASREMMDGHKAELLVIYLSFIGWVLLGMLTLGLAFIYVDPYMEQTVLNFYDRIKNEAE